MNEANLLKLKRDIDAAKTKASELAGKKEYLMQELVNKWGCKTIKRAKEKLAEMDISIRELEQKICEGTESLEEML